MRANLRFDSYSPILSHTYTEDNVHQLPTPEATMLHGSSGWEPYRQCWSHTGARTSEWLAWEPEDTSHLLEWAERSVRKQLQVPRGCASRRRARCNHSVCAGPQQTLLQPARLSPDTCLLLISIQTQLDWLLGFLVSFVPLNCAVE